MKMWTKKQKIRSIYTLRLFPYSNFKPFINRYIVNKWQLLWNNSIGNKLFEITPVIGQSQPVVRNVRQEEVVLARLRIGHTRVTHSYLLKREEPT